MAAVITPQNLPVGYRFHPTDQEFVDHYLTNRVLGYVDRPCIIPDVDICRWDPWQLPGIFRDASIIGPDDQVQEWWFFCPHTPQQVKRSTPSGFWKKTGANRNVKARDSNEPIGTKKTLVFHRGRGKGNKTNWVIHEYHLITNDLNRTYVLCRLKHKRDEKADNSTPESESRAINLADFDLDLHQPDHKDLFPEPLVQAKMKSLMEQLHQPENRVEFNSADLVRLFQPANNSFPSNIHQRANSESPSVMDISLDSGLTDESIQLTFGISEEDEDIGNMRNADLSYADYFDGYMQTEYGQTSNLHNEHPVLLNRRAQTTDSVHGFVPVEEKKGMVENKFNGSPVAPEKPEPRPLPKAPHRPMAPPPRPASAKCYGKDEEPRFEKVKKETADINIKQECISLDEIPARAKYGQVSITENRHTQTTGRTRKILHCPPIENTICWQVLGYKEHGSASNSPQKTNSKEIEHARGKSTSVAASTGTTSEGTESYTNPPLPNLLNVLVGIFLVLAITCQVLGF